MTRSEIKRSYGYVILAFVLIILHGMFEAVAWGSGSAQMHTIMEVVATLLALNVGALALLRYYTKRNNIILLVGVAFVGTALLDGYHAVVTSDFFRDRFPSSRPSLIAWSWTASRTFLALVTLLSWWAGRREQKRGGAFNAWAVYSIVITLTLLSFGFFAFFPLPRAYFPELVVGRPEEYVSALFFLGALIGFLSRGVWRRDAFEGWFVAFLIVSFFCQATFMPRSTTLFDGMFEMAHILKILSYSIVLVGLGFDVYYGWKHEQELTTSLERRVQERTELLEKKNTDLQTEIVERKRIEGELNETAAELIRSNQELALFASVASHDLQEPLRIVASYVELLANRYQGKLDDKADRWIQFTVDAAARMRQLITDLLEFSRVGASGKPLLPTDFEAVIAAALLNLQQAIQECGARIRHGSLPTVLGDDTQLTQVMQNLIGNALKFRAPDRTPEVHIEVEAQEGHWLFSVKDNGIGIEPQFVQKIFVIFQRLHSREAYSGTGIGLAVCKKIIERHGGRIWAESQLGMGTTFFFSLPDRAVRGANRQSEETETG